MGDCPLQKEAQEGSRGGCCQEKEQENPEVPESRSWSHPPGHHGQEEPEARGEEGPERAGRQSRQGAEEADCFQEGSFRCCQEGKESPRQGSQECTEICSKNWRKEINIDIIGYTL